MLRACSPPGGKPRRERCLELMEAGRFSGMKPIAVYGATGYTGRKVAEELRRRDQPVLVAGRNPTRLREQASRLGDGVEARAAKLEDQAALRRLASDSRLILNCAGPFLRTAAPLLAAAVAEGTHYLDISADQHSTHLVLSESDAAREAGVALLPACGFYGGIGDLLAGLAARGLEPLEELSLNYAVDNWRASASAATFEEVLLGMTREWFTVEAGEVRSHHRWLKTHIYDFGPPLGRRRVMPYPTPEVLLARRHLDASCIRSTMTASTLSPFGRLAPSSANAAGRLLRTPARPVIRRSLRRLWRDASADEKDGDPTRFTVVAEARGRAAQRRAVAVGQGIYDLTGPLAASAAQLLLQRGNVPAGALSLAELCDPADFLAGLAPYGLEVRFDSA
jgi:short subunit dehydrogenase-like uncharacterized protein